jgi:cell division protein FtsB
MMNIYYLLTLVLVAIGSAYVSRLYPRVKAWFLSVIYARRNKLNERIELLEKRVELHTRKDGTYLNKFDALEFKTEELEEQINNLSGTLTRRTKNDRDMIRREVKEYLKQLQK